MAAIKRKRLSSSSYQPVLNPQKDNKPSNATESWDRKTKELALQFVLEDLPESPFRAICIKAAELEAYSRHLNSDCNEDKVQKDVLRSVEEEIRKQDQARLGTILTRETDQRLLGCKKTGTKGGPESGRKFVSEKYESKGPLLRFGLRPCSDEKPRIIKLTGLTIFGEIDGQGGDTVVGTLAAHVDRFTYTTSSTHYHLQFTFKNVKEAFYQVEDKNKMPPLLHFHLHHHIKVGTEMTKDIQFRLVPTPVRQRRLDNDSYKFEKDRQTRDRGHNEDLKNFVDEVQNKWRGSPSPFPFRRVYKEEEFHGDLPSKASADFILTLSSLIRLANTPFVVVNLEDIEIVNLAKLRPGEIDMTVVFKDFKCDVLQIRSIPLDSLNGIKRCLDFWGVKFYENDLDPNWNSILKKIADSPETFIQEGRWDGYKLEDNATSLYYKHYCLEASQVVYDDTHMYVD